MSELFISYNFFLLYIVHPCSLVKEDPSSVESQSLEVLLSFSLAHGNVNHIIDVIMILLGEGLKWVRIEGLKWVWG